jgi:hypothetical protein
MALHTGSHAFIRRQWRGSPTLVSYLAFPFTEALDVFNPHLVLLRLVAAQWQNFDAALLELGRQRVLHSIN